MNFFIKKGLVIMGFFSLFSCSASGENPKPFVSFDQWAHHVEFSEKKDLLRVSNQFYSLAGGKPVLINKPDVYNVVGTTKNFEKIAYVSKDKKIRIDADEKTIELDPSVGNFASPVKAFFNPDETRFAIQTYNYTEGARVYLYSSETGKLERKIPEIKNFEGFEVSKAKIIDFFYTKENLLILKMQDYEDDCYLVFSGNGSELIKAIIPPDITTGVKANLALVKKSPAETLGVFEIKLNGTKFYKNSSLLKTNPLGPLVVEWKTGKTVFDAKTLPGWSFFLFLNEEIFILRDAEGAYAFYDYKKHKILSKFTIEKNIPRSFGITKTGQVLYKTASRLTLRSPEKLIFEKDIAGLGFLELESGDFALITYSGLVVISHQTGETLFSVNDSVASDTRGFQVSLTDLGFGLLAVTTKKDLLVFDLKEQKLVLKKDLPQYHYKIIPFDSRHFLSTKSYSPGIADFHSLVARPKNTVLLWEIPSSPAH